MLLKSCELNNYNILSCWQLQQMVTKSLLALILQSLNVFMNWLFKDTTIRSFYLDWMVSENHALMNRGKIKNFPFQTMQIDCSRLKTHHATTYQTKFQKLRYHVFWWIRRQSTMRGRNSEQVKNLLACQIF